MTQRRATIIHALPETEQMVECVVTSSTGAVVHQKEAPLAAVRLALGQSMSAAEVEEAINSLLFTGTVITRPSTAHDNPADKTAATFRLKRNG
ncbi:hypothetical protein NKH72_21665 [Mesorhizobium sp. M0955]|uniref:hypothetical protein n=1 Tax=Mesorhizobium sp. M0955 TaxID=2957033 RepID=UPI00333BC678